jgi:hypothetical protein
MGLGLKMFTKPGVHNDFFIAGRCRGRLPFFIPLPPTGDLHARFACSERAVDSRVLCARTVLLNGHPPCVRACQQRLLSPQILVG